MHRPSRCKVDREFFAVDRADDVRCSVERDHDRLRHRWAGVVASRCDGEGAGEAWVE